MAAFLRTVLAGGGSLGEVLLGVEYDCNALQSICLRDGELLQWVAGRYLGDLWAAVVVARSNALYLGPPLYSRVASWFASNLMKYEGLKP